MATDGRKCFQCGLVGHQTADCTVEQQTAEGMEAFLVYKAESTTRRLQYKTKKKPRHKLYHFYKLQASVQSENQICDPVALVRTTNEKVQQKDLHCSHRELFNDSISRIRDRFSHNGDNSKAKAQHDKLWQRALSEAVEKGQPADFTSNYANRVYAVNKLIPRCRYLHDLVLHDNAICAGLRRRLLPTADTCKSSVQMCSMGGGPGYDHVAICLVTWYLYKIQPQQSIPPRIRTRVFDLFDQEWLPILTELQECLHREAAHHKDDWWNSSFMTMHHNDLREEELEEELKTAIQQADIITFQFVLHENASFIVQGDEIGGAVAYILQEAKVSAVMVCTDSGNRLWSALMATATRHGWACKSTTDADLNKCMLGAKSFVLLERVEVK